MRNLLETRRLLRRERYVRLAAVLMIIASALVIILAVENLLASFVLAFVINYLLDPIVDAFERRGLPRTWAIVIPFLALAIVIGISISLLVPLISDQIRNLDSEFPTMRNQLAALITKTEHKLQSYLNIQEFSFSKEINNWLIQSFQYSTHLGVWLQNSLTTMILAPFFAFFMLLDGRKISRSLLALVPNNVFEMFLNIQYQLNDQIGGFIRARLFEGLIVGAVVWLGLQIMGFPYAGLIGLAAGVTNLIPYVGPIIGALPAMIICLVADDPIITDSTTIDLVLVSGVYLIAQLIDIIFIIPLVVAKIVNLHPVTVLLAIIIGAQVLGILGMIISIPVASAVKLVFSTLYRHLVAFRGQSLF